MSDPGPLVSILINNYNYGRFLRDAIDSALGQTYSNIEVIVVDDGSTDDSREIIASYGDRITSVLKENGGQASAFNAGFRASHGEWLLFLDSDDLFLPGKAQEVVRLARLNPGAGMIAHNLEYCDTEGAPIGFLPAAIREARQVDDRKRVRQGRPTASFPATSGLCIRREIFEQMVPMPEDFVTAADNYVKLVALLLAPVLQVPGALGRQRIHDRNHYTSNRARSEPEACRRAVVNAGIGFHIKQRFPQLKRVVWKYYGRTLYQLGQAKSAQAVAVKADIRSRYSVMEWSPECLFYVCGAYTKAFLRNLPRGRFSA